MWVRMQHRMRTTGSVIHGPSRPLRQESSRPEIGDKGSSEMLQMTKCISTPRPRRTGAVIEGIEGTFFSKEKLQPEGLDAANTFSAFWSLRNSSQPTPSQASRMGLALDGEEGP